MTDVGKSSFSTSLRTVPAELRNHYLEAGAWTEDTIGGFLFESLSRHRKLELHVWSETHPYVGTFGEALDASLRVAKALQDLGIREGDAVATQLPNWFEAIVAFWATVFCGAVPVPIVHFYGAKEAQYILQRTGAKMLVIADQFRSANYVEQLDGYRGTLTDLEHVVLVSGGSSARVPEGGAIPFPELLASTAMERPVDRDPDSPALIAYTSGTTSAPKGVVHAHRSLVPDVDLGRRWRWYEDERPGLVATPISHASGLISALIKPAYFGRDIHMMDIFQADKALDIMRRKNLQLQTGPPYFLTSILDSPTFEPDDIELVRYQVVGGSPIPDATVERAALLGVCLSRAYGSTEMFTLTTSGFDEPADRRIQTDGHPLEFCEIRICEPNGEAMALGTPGEIWARSPHLFIGYMDAELTERFFTEDGWYKTGDVGFLDEQGYLKVTDRVQDIIIRGGENISAAEVEDLVMRYRGVAEVAVVAAPDELFVERPFAFVRLYPDADEFTLEELREYLIDAGLGRQKCPEGLQFVSDFPRTPSTKVQKFKLRQELRERATGTRGP